MRKRSLITSTFLFVASMALAQTSLQGKLTDIDTNEPVLFANIAVYKNGVLVTGGNLKADNIAVGKQSKINTFFKGQTQKA